MEVKRSYKKPRRSEEEAKPLDRGPALPPKKQEEYILECLQMMPVVAGTGAVTHSAVLKGWAKHLVDAGSTHVEYLETLADENGYIHVSQLPRRKKKLVAPMRGPRHGYNNAARWVDVNAKATPPPVVQDPRTMTVQEREAQLGIYREMGYIPGPDARRDVAIEIK